MTTTTTTTNRSTMTTTTNPPRAGDGMSIAPLYGMPEAENLHDELFGYSDQTVPPNLRADIVEELIDTLIYNMVLLDIRLFAWQRRASSVMFTARFLRLNADIDAEVEKVVAKCVARWGREA